MVGWHQEGIRPPPIGQAPDAEAVPQQLQRHVDRPEEHAIADATRARGLLEVYGRDLT
jgi:hypothetical protein